MEVFLTSVLIIFCRRLHYIDETGLKTEKIRKTQLNEKYCIPTNARSFDLANKIKKKTLQNHENYLAWCGLSPGLQTGIDFFMLRNIHCGKKSKRA